MTEPEPGGVGDTKSLRSTHLHTQSVRGGAVRFAQAPTTPAPTALAAPVPGTRTLERSILGYLNDQHVDDGGPHACPAPDRLRLSDVGWTRCWTGSAPPTPDLVFGPLPQGLAVDLITWWSDGDMRTPFETRITAEVAPPAGAPTTTVDRLPSQRPGRTPLRPHLHPRRMGERPHQANDLPRAGPDRTLRRPD